MMKRTHLTDEQLEARLMELPETVDQTLKTLTADEALKRRIERAVTAPERETVRRPLYRTLVPALSLALVLTVGVAVGLKQNQPDPIITSRAAGNTIDPQATNIRGLSQGRVTVTTTSAPEYRSLWEGSNASFPLIGVNGSYYRMMSAPATVDQSLLGESLGAVSEFTTEPSLSGTDVILSNAATLGTNVYPVKNMSGTFVAAEVGGTMRLFQRVSFNGSALQGRETLADTLQLSGHIASMELSDVGLITDSSACEKLYQTLIGKASYDSSGSVSARQSLIIQLDNGLTVQLAVRNDKLAACGTWSCPEFFEEFEEALE